MRTTKKTALVVLFLLLIEVLYLQIDPVSFGFPFRSVEYRAVDISGAPRSWADEELPFGFNIEPMLLVSDILFVLLLALLLIQCVPPSVIMPLLQGCVLGSVIATSDYWLNKILSESLLSTIMGSLIFFLLLPIIIYILTLKSKWHKTSILIISFTTMTTSFYALVLLEVLLDGTHWILSNLQIVLRLIAFSCIFACESFVLMFLHKKVLPLVLRKKRLKSSSEIVDNTVPLIASDEKKANRKITLKRAILYVSLLVIPTYIGHHFMMVRKLRNDDLLFFEAIESKLERLNIPQYKRLEEPVKGSIRSMMVTPKSFDPGWIASCRAEVEVGNEKFSAEIRKHVFIPWLQVEIHKK